MKRGLKSIKNKTTEWLTNRLLYVLVGIAGVVFVAFWTIGFDMPYLDNPSMNAPLLTGLLLGLTEVFVIAALVVAIWAVIRSMRNSKDYTKNENGINAGRIQLCVFIGTVVVLLLTFILGSSSTLRVNGKLYSDWFWLKTSDMFVWSSVILLVLAILAVVFGTTSYHRQRKEEH